jgi:hypothetical protein
MERNKRRARLKIEDRGGKDKCQFTAYNRKMVLRFASGFAKLPLWLVEEV